jgi:hybrid cluster-associated redox disulfide protein
MSKKEFKLTKDSNIMETIENYPGAVEVFFRKGLPCAGCAAARFEKISDVVEEFGVDPDELIEEIKNTQKNKN